MNKVKVKDFIELKKDESKSQRYELQLLCQATAEELRKAKFPPCTWIMSVKEAVGDGWDVTVVYKIRRCKKSSAFPGELKNRKK